MPSAVRLGDMHFCTDNGPNNEATLMIANASPNITINGLPAARVGDAVSCRMSGVSLIAEGSSKVIFNGQAAARTGDSTDNGGSLLQGSGNVFIGNGNAKVTLGNSAKINFGSQAKIYLSSSAAGEGGAPSAASRSAAVLNVLGTALIIGGIPLDDVGVGEAMQTIGGRLRLAAKMEEMEEAVKPATDVSEPSAAPMPPPPEPPNQCSNNAPSYKKLDSNYLKKQGIDAHAFKKYLVKNNGGSWDIQIDKCTSEVSLISKTGEISPTEYSSLEEVAEDFPIKK